MDIFKRGDKVWFEYEISGHSYERCGFILDGPFDNGFYRIRNAKGAVDFYIHKDKIHYERPDERIKKLEEAYSKAEAMCDNSEPRKVCKTCKNRECGLAYEPCLICKDHDKWEPTGGYIYPVGARVRFEYREKELIGYIQERYQDYVSKKYEYRINVDDKFYVLKPDSILGYAVNWIDDPSIRKAFGLDVNKNDIYENIKKQINKDQLNFHYGLRSIFPLAPNDAAVPFELSEKEKEYVHNDMSATMSYLCHLHKNGFYGTGADTKIIIDDALKEDNMKNTKLIRSNGTYKKEIKNVIFSGPVTTVVFEDEFDIAYGRVIKSKTNVRCQEGDEFDKTTGFLLALVKTFVDKQSYDNILRTIDGFEEDKIEKHIKYTRKHIKLEKKCEDDWKFMVGDLVRLKSGNIIFKVVRTLTWNYNGKVIHRYAIRRFGGSKYITYENENRLTLVEPTTDRLTKSMIKE